MKDPQHPIARFILLLNDDVWYLQSKISTCYDGNNVSFPLVAIFQSRIRNCAPGLPANAQLHHQASIQKFCRCIRVPCDTPCSSQLLALRQSHSGELLPQNSSLLVWGVYDQNPLAAIDFRMRNLAVMLKKSTRYGPMNGIAVMGAANKFARCACGCMLR
jgi:hypothetical protein